MNIYIIKDHGTKSYQFPMFSPTEREMTRNLVQALEHPDSLLRRFPRDYSIHLVGSFNTDTGEITPCEHQTIYSDLQDLIPTAKDVNQQELELNS